MSDMCAKCGFDIDSQIAAVDEKNAELTTLRSQVERLTGERENHIMELAGISTASFQNTESGIKDRITKENPYWTVAYGDVCVAVDREIRERKRAENAELLAKYKDETATTFMNQVKKLQNQVEQLTQERDKAVAACAVMRQHVEQALFELEKGGNNREYNASWVRPTLLNREQVNDACIQAYHQLHQALSTTCGNSLLERLKEARELLREAHTDADAGGRPVTLNWVERVHTWLKGTP